MSDRFDELATEVSERASGVHCDIRSYIDGLGRIIDRLEIDKRAAEETARGMGQAEDDE